MSIYLAKMALHHQVLFSKNANLLAASSIFVALKICEQMRGKVFMDQQLQKAIEGISSLEETTLVETSKKLLYLAQNFEKELPGLENLKKVYLD